MVKKQLMLYFVTLLLLASNALCYAFAERITHGNLTSEMEDKAINHLRCSRINAEPGWESAVVLKITTRMSHGTCVTWQGLIIYKDGRSAIIDTRYPDQMTLFISVGDHVLFDNGDGDFKITPPIHVGRGLVDEIRVIKRGILD